MIKLSNGLMADISTLKLDRLQRLPQLPGGMGVNTQMGSGCFLEPPGHPSYFMRSVGGDCRAYVISIGDGVYIVDGETYNGGWKDVNWVKYGAPKDRQERLNWLYSPLPVDHPRVRAWIEQLYRHQRNCYRIEGEKDFVVFPTQSHDFIKMGLFVPEPSGREAKLEGGIFDHLSEETKERYRVTQAGLMAEAQETVKIKREAFNAERAKACTPDRHLAVLSVRKFYPEYQPELDLINAEQGARPADWWTVLATKPDPCPMAHKPHMRFVCQYCGDKSDGTPGPNGEVYNNAKDGNKEVYAGYVYHNEAAKVEAPRA
jgi:hypothetical protein